MYGSAMTLIRPLLEAYVRGLWLMHGASDDDVDNAGKDMFPRDFQKLLSDLEVSGYLAADGVAGLKAEWWKRLCSFTHTGYQQIGARLTPDGLGYGYTLIEVDQALQWADAIALLVVVSFASVMRNDAVAVEVWDYFRTVFGREGEPA